MNWCFIKHSWEYKEEMITYTNKLKSITMPTKVRLLMTIEISSDYVKMLPLDVRRNIIIEEILNGRD
jgi:hypothetical protein